MTYEIKLKVTSVDPEGDTFEGNWEAITESGDGAQWGITDLAVVQSLREAGYDGEIKDVKLFDPRGHDAGESDCKEGTFIARSKWIEANETA